MNPPLLSPPNYSNMSSQPQRPTRGEQQPKRTRGRPRQNLGISSLFKIKKQQQEEDQRKH